MTYTQLSVVELRRLSTVVTCLLISYLYGVLAFLLFPGHSFPGPTAYEMGHHSQVGLDSMTCPKVASEGNTVGLQFDEQLLLC